MTPPPNLQDLIDTVRHDAGTEDPIGQLTVAATTASALEDTTDALLGHFVDRCRRAGRSWSEISAALGVTKQAVHKRFATAVADQLLAAVPAPTLERFTERARVVLRVAGRAARSAGREEVASEDLLVGLFDEPNGIAGRALLAMGVSPDHVRAAIVAARPADGAAEPGSSQAQAAGTPRFAEDAKRTLRDALAVALELAHNYIGTEHILLALYRGDDSLPARILAEAGATEDKARAHVAELLSGSQKS